MNISLGVRSDRGSIYNLLLMCQKALTLKNELWSARVCAPLKITIAKQIIPSIEVSLDVK